MRAVELRGVGISEVEEMACPELRWRSPRCAGWGPFGFTQGRLAKAPVPTRAFPPYRPSHIGLEGAGVVTFVIIRRAKESDTITVKVQRLGLRMF